MNRKFPRFAALLAGSLLTAAAFAQQGANVQTTVTVMPKNNKETPPTVSAQDIKARVDGKDAPVVNWVPLRGSRAGLQLVVLIDNSARGSLSLQFNDIRKFIQQLPPNSQVGVAYMQNGQAVFSQNPTTDKNQAAQALRIPQGIPGGNASPYFCLSDLVKRWPGAENGDRREVLMVTDGVDLYYGRRYDPNDPYVLSAITDAQRAGVIVHSIFYSDSGRFDNGLWTQAGAQDYLQQVSQGTGGKAYWYGIGNPVSFAPFLDDLQKRLQNQYELGVSAQPHNKAELQSLKVSVNTPNTTVDAPQRVLVPGSESPGQ